MEAPGRKLKTVSERRPPEGNLKTVSERRCPEGNLKKISWDRWGIEGAREQIS